MNQEIYGGNIGGGPVGNSIEPEHISQGDLHIIFDAACIECPEEGFFTPEYWQSQNALLSVAQGRGAACIFRFQDKDFVLRHYRRGGFMARLSDDLYKWSGLDNTRAWREWHLLAEMFQRGLPVPRPVAARIQRLGLFYRADLVTLCLSNARTLADVLSSCSLSESQWQAVGAVIRNFHDAGIFHADLNARNIMIDDRDKIYLIDFDKGEKRAVADSWQQSNLDRLQRSLNKFKKSQPQFCFDERPWQQLLLGYRS